MEYTYFSERGVALMNELRREWLQRSEGGTTPRAEGQGQSDLPLLKTPVQPPDRQAGQFKNTLLIEGKRNVPNSTI